MVVVVVERYCERIIAQNPGYRFADKAGKCDEYSCEKDGYRVMFMARALLGDFGMHCNFLLICLYRAKAHGTHYLSLI